MDVPGAVYTIWTVLLVVAVVVVLPLALYLLHRLLRAARAIERYTAEALAAGLGIAGNVGAVSALDRTLALGGELGAVAGSIRRHSAAIEKTLADRTS
jgi:hypothetical protein